MSRVGNLPIKLPQGVDLLFSGDQIIVKGVLGSLTQFASDLVQIVLENGVIIFTALNATKHAKQMHGTMRALVAGMVKGVSSGFERKLQMVGVGFNATVQGRELVLRAGYSHLVKCQIPDGVTVTCPTPSEIWIKGINNHTVGQFAAKVCDVRRTEPYKGKGIRPYDRKPVLKVPKKK
jgi:large subunit ribosomal protein L6